MQKKARNLRLGFELYLLALLLGIPVLLPHVSARVLGQNLASTKVSLKITEEPLYSAIKKLEKTSKIRFAYNSKDFEGHTVHSKHFIDESVGNILNTFLKGTPLGFKEVSTRLVITTASSNPVSTANLSSEDKAVKKGVAEKPLQVSVSGIIRDENGVGLPGVNILLKGTTTGTTTNDQGRFRINTPEQSTLVVSFVGYLSQEIKVSTKEIDIVLTPDHANLEEVLVVGYGTSSRRDLTGAISSISAKNFEKQPLYRIEDALQGRAAGVQVTKNSGVPGADINIRVRGVNSINGDNQPLVVIDGLIGSDLRSINSNDIASIEVLGDASATAIYGSRGANGVILVTTKRGTDKPTITIDAFRSVSNVTKKMNLLTPQEFASNNNLKLTNGGTDYQDEYFQAGYTNNLQVSSSGKKDKVGYFVSANALDQKGIVINSNYSRYSLRTNLDIGFTKKFSAQLNVYGSTEKTLNLIAGGISSSPDTRAGIISVLGWDPTLPVKNSNGSYNLLSSYGSGLINPVAQRLESNARQTFNRVSGNLNLSYEITPDLNLTVVGGLFSSNIFSENYQGIPSGTALGLITGASGSGAATNQVTLQNSNILTWKKSLGLHNVKVTGLFENQYFTSRSLTANGGEYAIPANFYALNLGTQPLVGANLSKYQIQSWMARTEYNYQRKLYLTATVRADISSKFRKGNRTGVFSSAAVAYQFDNLFNDFVEGLKVRAGYGETGNQGIPPYSTYNTLATGLNYPLNGVSESRGIGLTGGVVGNEKLTWETTKQTNVGIDFTIFRGKLDVTANKYWKKTENLLLGVPIADYLGGGSVLQNVGSVGNSGWELALSATPVKTDKFNWTVNANYSYNQNRVKSLYGDVDQLLISPLGAISNTAGSAYTRLKVGEPMGQFYGATFLGTYKTGATDGTPGNARYLKDSEGNLVLNVLGNGIPKHTWALNNTFTYSSFDLNIVVLAVQGFDVMNLTRAKISMSGGTQGSPTYGEYRNRWTPENQTDVPVAGDLFVNSSRFVEKGNFVRVSNLALGYNVAGLRSLKGIRIYASAQNLLTITGYKGFDPEASSTQTGLGSAGSIDYGANPNARTFVFGVNFKI